MTDVCPCIGLAPVATLIEVCVPMAFASTSLTRIAAKAIERRDQDQIDVADDFPTQQTSTCLLGMLPTAPQVKRLLRWRHISLEALPSLAHNRAVGQIAAIG